MSRIQMLRVLVNQRLTAAAEEIFEIIERTIVEYEEEIDRQRRLLVDVLKPERHVNKADPPQLFVRQVEFPPEQLDWSASLEQKDPEPPRIKEEEEELWTSQEGEQLQDLEEADITTFPFTPVPVKSENEVKSPHSKHNDTEPLASTSTQQIQAEVEDYGLSEPAINFDPASNGRLFSSGCYEIDTEDIDWKESREPQSGLIKLENDTIHLSQMNSHTGEEPLICMLCGERFSSEEQLKKHMIIHSEKKAFNCSFCGKGFHKKAHLQVHVRSHTGERPFCCSLCGKGFVCKEALQRHMKIHTGEKPFDCSVCGKRFGYKFNLTTHMKLHTGEKSFDCSLCGRKFVQKCNLKVHMRFHTGEKPYGCSGCGEKFSQLSHVKSHKCGTAAVAVSICNPTKLQFTNQRPVSSDPADECAAQRSDLLSGKPDDHLNSGSTWIIRSAGPHHQPLTADEAHQHLK